MPLSQRPPPGGGIGLPSPDTAVGGDLEYVKKQVAGRAPPVRVLLSCEKALSVIRNPGSIPGRRGALLMLGISGPADIYEERDDKPAKLIICTGGDKPKSW